MRDTGKGCKRTDKKIFSSSHDTAAALEREQGAIVDTSHGVFNRFNIEGVQRGEYFCLEGGYSAKRYDTIAACR